MCRLLHFSCNFANIISVDFTILPIGNKIYGIVDSWDVWTWLKVSLGKKEQSGDYMTYDMTHILNK